MKTCSFEGCDKGGRILRGWCVMHYTRWLNHGDPSIVLPKTQKKRGVCSVDRCAELTDAKGLCRSHYRRWKRYGDPLGEPKPRPKPMCQACDRVAHARGLCTMHYQRLTKTGTLEARPMPAFAERLWTKIVRLGSGDCWEWQGATLKGYGQIQRAGRIVYAHRAVFEFIWGCLPAELVVCHRCDNPPCCNPAHLFPGTMADNVADMISKGRGHWQQASTSSARGDSAGLPEKHSWEVAS